MYIQEERILLVFSRNVISNKQCRTQTNQVVCSGQLSGKFDDIPSRLLFGNFAYRIRNIYSLFSLKVFPLLRFFRAFLRKTCLIFDVFKWSLLVLIFVRKYLRFHLCVLISESVLNVRWGEPAYIHGIHRRVVFVICTFVSVRRVEKSMFLCKKWLINSWLKAKVGCEWCLQEKRIALLFF